MLSRIKRGFAALSLFALAGTAFAAAADLGQAEKQATNWTAIVMFGAFVVFTLFVTKWAASKTKSANDFYTAGGGITGFQNGLAIAGDYMSAASFLGISAAVFLNGIPESRDILRSVAGRADLVVAADGGRCPPLVCTNGQPRAATMTLLRAMASAGVKLRHHGDFDWPGITIANFVMRGFGANPWRYATGDFRAESGFSLTGPPVAASWDADLASKMAAAGLGLHEEAVIEDLLLDLAQS